MAENTAPPVKDDSKEPIRASEVNPRFKHELMKIHGGEKLLKCFQCGTCTSDCPVARYSDSYRPRTILHMASLGLKDRVLKSDTLWLCAACFTCSDHCPQGVEVANVIRILRNVAAEEGHYPQVFKDQVGAVLESGYAYKIPDLRLKKRGSLGLPPLPPGNPEVVKKILKGVKFIAKLESKGEADAKQ